jgi:hypothetical protein
MNVTTANVDELKADENVDRVYAAIVKAPFNLYPVYDNNFKIDFLEMEQGDCVLVSVNHDGMWYINFLSIYPQTYHYRCIGIGSMADNEHVHIELPLKEL